MAGRCAQVGANLAHLNLPVGEIGLRQRVVMFYYTARRCIADAHNLGEGQALQPAPY